MKPPKWMDFPRRIIVGSNVLQDAPILLRDIGIIEGPVLMITGKKSYEVCGSYLKDILEDNDYSVDIVQTGDVTRREFTRVIEGIRKKDTEYEIIVGVGGGSKIDMAKLIARELSIDYVSVPTIASHDGIASPRASIKENYEQVSIQVKSPIAILADTAIIARADYRYTASGIADVIGNITAVRDWILAHKLKGEPFSESAAALSLTAARIILKNAESIRPNLEESTRLVVKALAMSGVSMGVAGSSRPASGSEHLFAHALTRIAPGKGLHGELVGLGTIMMAYLHGINWKRIKKVLETVGAPTSAYDLGIDPEDVILALTIAHKIRKRYTILGESGLSEDAARTLAKRTGVI
ncbi:MAG: NAD(P)-dependent glycerol-1-phosphate dehydrogenase [Euryarchaeota archaeon]|nr:NAD(P)-dependent glycerol-1-phosphate dehydrogenase [Euryarchaeota archaeon]